MPFTYGPKSATTISSADEAARLDNSVSAKDRWVSGMGALSSGASLDVTIQTGIAMIAGRQVGAGSDQTVTLAASNTNHVFVDKDGAVTANTSGVPPTDSIKLYEFVTDGVGVTATTDKRDNTVDMEAPVKADKVTSDGDVAARSGNVETKELHLYDGAGVLQRKARLNAGKFQIVDSANADKNSDIASPVDETDTDTTKNKAVSNSLAKGWQDHKNASAPHAGHSLAADEGVANGIATLDASTRVVEAVKKVQAAVPAASAEVGLDGGEFKVHDGTAVRILEKTSRKGVADGYAALDSGGVVPAAQLPAATTTVKGAVILSDDAPQPLAAAAALGASTQVAREDHAHAHGDRSADAAVTHHGMAQVSGVITDTQHGARGGGDKHAVATGGAAGFMSAADKTSFDANLPTAGEKASFVNVPTASEKAALPGTSGAPSGSNKYVTDADARNTNSRTPLAHASTHALGGGDPLTGYVRIVTGSYTGDGNASGPAQTVGFRPKQVFIAGGVANSGWVADPTGSDNESGHGIVNNANGGLDSNNIDITANGFTPKGGTGFNTNAVVFRWVAYG